MFALSWPVVLSSSWNDIENHFQHCIMKQADRKRVNKAHGIAPNASSAGREDDMPEKIIAAIPQDTPDHMLEVALIGDQAQGLSVELRTLAWGNGLGWYRQHTVTLDSTSLQGLQRALGQIQGYIRHSTPQRQSATIIPFPCAPSRHAAPPERASA
jgi:hypothetical protein